MLSTTNGTWAKPNRPAALISVSFGRITNIYTAADPTNPTMPSDEGFGLVGGDGLDKLSATSMRALLSAVGECEPEVVRAVARHADVFSVGFDCNLHGTRHRASAVWSVNGDILIGSGELGLGAAYRVVSLAGSAAPLQV